MAAASTTSAAESPFCDTCQRNQILVNKTLAEYIPDEDDPEYDKYVDSADDYRAELEERYPSVCDECIGRVRDQIRAAGYATKTDHLRRALEQSKKNMITSQTPRQIWTLRLVAAAKWTYVSNVVVGVIWHVAGVLVRPEDALLVDSQFPWKACLGQVVNTRQLGQTCLTSPSIMKVVDYALLADLFTIWWNPKLEQKTNRPGRRMRGLKTVWLTRAVVLLGQWASLHFQPNLQPGEDDALERVHYMHAAMLVITVFSAIFTWKAVQIVPQSAVMRPIDPHLPNAPRSSEKPTRAQQPPNRPMQSSFDTMAQSFTSSFPSNELTESDDNLPPSPTLTAVSSSTHDTEASTPWRRRSTKSELDDMDWTPTQKKFADNGPAIIPPLWNLPSPKPASQQQPPAPEPHSIFSKPDPNPFRHKVPAAPKAPAHAKYDPWKRGVWPPPAKEPQTTLFQGTGTQGANASGTGLRGIGVPKNVQRDAELFAQPKMKFDYYGKPKETGLEDTFNSLFSK
ncbi:Ima1 N-terminal domain-containing protein [Massariosphaeria phaeospora]|uniref:Ima1 N-terminal domain-containing protein n=1 Tax=Massariosphaeria phaeospora TaxID=100035 RepID=A0A7C8I7L4_9PLEO|nr:Ima1 N-terminal domain-containing protein [Massariosphaeria phaeospora]